MLKSSSLRRVQYGLTLAVLALMITSMITSCSNPPVQDTTESLAEPVTSVQKQYSTSGVPVTEPHKIKWLVQNNLITEEQREENSKHTINYVKIAGLKDKNVETKINDRIQSKVTEIEKALQPETIAPFRGVRTKIFEDSKLLNSSVYSFTAFNFNHILSVQFQGSGNYGADGSMYGGENTIFLNISDAINIDLNTGDEIALKDIFVNGYDYVSAINDYIMKEIGNQNGIEEFKDNDDYMFYYNGYQLVAPFDGISEEQPYGLARHTLIVMFPPDDPRFISANFSVSFAIPLGYFGDNLAIDQRFYASDTSLYDDAKTSMVLISWGNGQQGGGQWEEGSFDNGRYTINIYNNTDVFDERFDAYVEDLRSYLKSLHAEGRDNFVDAYVTKREIGGFVTFSKNWWSVMSQVNGYYSEQVVYDENGDKKELSDLFVPGFDYETVIRERIKAQYMKTNNLTEAEFFQYYGQRQFSIEDMSLSFSFPAPDMMKDYGTIWASIEFDEFGIENLTIFEE